MNVVVYLSHLLAHAFARSVAGARYFSVKESAAEEVSGLSISHISLTASRQCSATSSWSSFLG